MSRPYQGLPASAGRRSPTTASRASRATRSDSAATRPTTALGKRHDRHRGVVTPHCSTATTKRHRGLMTVMTLRLAGLKAGKRHRHRLEREG
jgi:hypothetical protein